DLMAPAMRVSRKPASTKGSARARSVRAGRGDARGQGAGPPSPLLGSRVRGRAGAEELRGRPRGHTRGSLPSRRTGDRHLLRAGRPSPWGRWGFLQARSARSRARAIMQACRSRACRTAAVAVDIPGESRSSMAFELHTVKPPAGNL